jgi:hypothetical protein
MDPLPAAHNRPEDPDTMGRNPMTSHQAGPGSTRARSAYACAMANGSWSLVTAFLPVITDHKPVPGGSP